MKKNIKKILFLITDFNSGGAESVFVQLANYFAKKYEVHFMVLKANGPNIEKLKKKIKITELKQSRSIYSIFKINKYIKKNEIDIAIGTLAMAYAVSIAKLFGSKNCKYIARIGSIVSSNLNDYGFIRKLLIRVYQKILNCSDKIVTQSRYMDRDLKNYLKKETHIIYNPIESKKIQLLSEEKTTINFDRNFYNILSIGRLEHEKDYKSALLSVSKLKDKIKNVKYFILGEGSLKQELEKYSISLGLKDHVIFTGYVKNPYPFIKNSDVILLTSLYEGFSNVILESLTLKTPVVATNSPGGNQEIIINGENGFLIQPGNIDDMVRKLILVKNQNKFKINVSKFELDLIGKEYEKLFN